MNACICIFFPWSSNADNISKEKQKLQFQLHNLHIQIIQLTTKDINFHYFIPQIWDRFQMSANTANTSLSLNLECICVPVSNSLCLPPKPWYCVFQIRCFLLHVDCCILSLLNLERFSDFLNCASLSKDLFVFYCKTNIWKITYVRWNESSEWGTMTSNTLESWRN